MQWRMQDEHRGEIESESCISLSLLLYQTVGMLMGRHPLIGVCESVLPELEIDLDQLW